MQPFEQKHRYQGCPNLNTQCILSGTDETLDPQVLFKGLKKQLDLTAFFVDVGDGRGTEVQVAG